MALACAEHLALGFARCEFALPQKAICLLDVTDRLSAGGQDLALALWPTPTLHVSQFRLQAFGSALELRLLGRVQETGLLAEPKQVSESDDLGLEVVGVT